MSSPRYSFSELLAKLVAFDTTSHKSNLPIIRFVEDYLAMHGIGSTLVPDSTGEKANLYATIGPSDVGGICLSGHTDVVPVTGQDWETDPFQVVEKGDRFYGRGTTDMKGFLACVLASVPRFREAQLKTPIHIAFSYDEEIGCVGVRPMLDQFGENLQTPAATIVGEPTLMGVVDAHKGPVRWHLQTTGRAAHSSMAPLGVNAISFTGRIIQELAAIEEELKVKYPNDRFDPPYPTLQITEISGGTASNIVPLTCELGFEIRALPGVDIDAITQRLKKVITQECLPQMQAVAPEASMDLSIANYVPPFGAQDDGLAIALAAKLTGRNRTSAVSYATEAGLFQNAGSSAVVCGPGDISQAHTANEWVDIDQLHQCMRFMEKLSDWCMETDPAQHSAGIT